MAQVLSLDEDVARILCEEGFETLEHVAYTPEAELLEIEGFKREVVAEMQNRAREIIEKEEAETRKKMTRMEPRYWRYRRCARLIATIGEG